MNSFLINGNALKIPLADKSVQCCITSPPYWGLRDYQIADQLGMEPSPEEYVENMVTVFREVLRVLKDDGTLWLNLGDSYAGSGGAGNWSKRKAGKQEYAGQRKNNVNRLVRSKRIDRGSGRWGGGNLPATGNLKPKDLVGIPWRVAFALQAYGWYLRSDIIWHKPNPMPESVRDRPTKSHEYIFLLTKNARYFYDAEAIKEESSTKGDIPAHQVDKARMDNGYDGHRTRVGLSRAMHFDGTRNKRSVWTVTTKPYSGAHFATFPPDLIDPCIKAGSAAGDIVLDPFIGSGTTCMVARNLGRVGVGLDLSMDYLHLARERLSLDALEAWQNGGKEVDANWKDTPLFSWNK